MAVKETSDTNNGATVSDTDLEWNAENELQLFQILCGNKPIGISRYFQMACVVEKLALNLNKEVTSKIVWDHLSSMYDLKKLDELEGVPFPLEETDFVLSPSEYGDLMASKVEENDTSRKVLKKEDEKKKEKTQEQTQSADKKTVKRTRASTGTANLPTTPTTPAVTPKRRRI